jgi:hypothetical protein
MRQAVTVAILRGNSLEARTAMPGLIGGVDGALFEIPGS